VWPRTDVLVQARINIFWFKASGDLLPVHSSRYHAPILRPAVLTKPQTQLAVVSQNAVE
jgi:hypothetical protein